MRIPISSATRLRPPTHLRRSLIVVAVLAVLLVAVAPGVAGSSGACAAAAAGGCPWQGPVVINSNHDYWMNASDGQNTIRAHVQTQCRIEATFALKGTHRVRPTSVSIGEFERQQTLVKVEFFTRDGQPILGFISQADDRGQGPLPGGLTTTYPQSGTDVHLPSVFRFPGLTYYLDGTPIDNVGAPIIWCRVGQGGQGKVHLASLYGARSRPYWATQMAETTDAIPTTYVHTSTSVFPEKQSLAYALRVLGSVRPRFAAFRFLPATLSDSRGHRTTTIGFTRYSIGHIQPMKRPTPCID